jgi:DNA-binding FadR family transcriptional regulator
MSEPALTSISESVVQAPRLADQVADRIRELIIDGALGDGERLPPLETLVEQFGVSIPSIREALRLLESEGLISVQRGSVGGSVVHRPTDRTAAYTLAMVLRSRKTTLEDVAEAMTLLDPLCAMLCARRADRKKTVVRELRKINKAASDVLDEGGLAFANGMASFHNAIMKHSGNNTLTLLVGALGSIWAVNFREWAIETLVHGSLPNRTERLASLEEHEHLTDLIAAGDALQVSQAMTEHIDMKPVLSTTDPNRLLAPHPSRSQKPIR